MQAVGQWIICNVLKPQVSSGGLILPAAAQEKHKELIIHSIGNAAATTLGIDIQPQQKIIARLIKPIPNTESYFVHVDDVICVYE